jgi:hypothetical protein
VAIGARAGGSAGGWVRRMLAVLVLVPEPQHQAAR